MNTFRLVLLLAVSAILLPTLARAAEQLVSVNMAAGAQASIHYTTACNIVPTHGYMPVLVRIENRSREERSWATDFTFQQYPPWGKGSMGNVPSNTNVLREHFTVAASSTLEKVVYVPVGGSCERSIMSITTQGPEVRFPTITLPGGSGLATMNYLAVSPALGSAISGMKDSRMRMVVYTSRDGSLQTRYVPFGSFGTFTFSNGNVVNVPAVGSPTVIPGGNPSTAVSFKISPSGDVTLVTPSGVYVSGNQTRLDPSFNTGKAGTPIPPPSMGRLVTIQTVPPRNTIVPKDGSGTWVFSDGSELMVPFSGTPTLTPLGSSVYFNITSTNRVVVTLPPNVQVTRSSTRGGSVPTSGTYRTSVPTPGTPQTLGSYTSVIDPTRWPADPRVWSLFTMVILETQEWERLDEARRAALRDWVALGGILVLSPDVSSAARSTESYGAGQIVHLEKSVKDYTQDDIMGLGLKDADRHSMPWTSVTAQLLSKDDWSKMVFQQNGIFVVILLLFFAAIAGPVTLFKLAPAGKRHRIFVIVPILCLSTTALLAVIIILQDGTGGNGIRRALVLLIPEDKRAVILQQQVARTGLLVGSSFKLAPETLLVRDPVPERCRPPGSTERWTCVRDGDEASGEWFASRTCQQHQLRQIVSTRASLELLKSPDGASLSIRSSLATTLSQLIYIDEARIRWEATNIAPGALVKLQRFSGPPEALRLKAHSLSSKPGWFYALGGPGDLAPLNTCDAIRWSTEEVLYAGRLGNVKELAP